jgi:biopolymer transport protein ExbD
MAGRRKKKKHELVYEDAELNIMPFIDVFSVLNTFLLFSAVFIALGSIKVQVPFFTNKQDPTPPKRALEVSVDTEREKIMLTTRFNQAPINETNTPFAANDAGISALHEALVRVRTQNPETDLVTLYTQDDVQYEMVIKVIDAIKMRTEKDPVFVPADADEKEQANKNFVFPKVVMGSVVLNP